MLSPVVVRLRAVKLEVNRSVINFYDFGLYTWEQRLICCHYTSKSGTERRTRSIFLAALDICVMDPVAKRSLSLGSFRRPVVPFHVRPAEFSGRLSWVTDQI